MGPHFDRSIEKNNPMEQLEKGKIYAQLHCISFITSFYIVIQAGYSYFSITTLSHSQHVKLAHFSRTGTHEVSMETS